MAKLGGMLSILIAGAAASGPGENLVANISLNAKCAPVGSQCDVWSPSCCNLGLGTECIRGICTGGQPHCKSVGKTCTSSAQCCNDHGSPVNCKVGKCVKSVPEASSQQLEDVILGPGDLPPEIEQPMCEALRKLPEEEVKEAVEAFCINEYELDIASCQASSERALDKLQATCHSASPSNAGNATVDASSIVCHLISTALSMIPLHKQLKKLLWSIIDLFLDCKKDASNVFVQGGTLKLDWSDCGDSSYHAKVQSLSPTALPIGQTTTVTGSGNTDEQVTAGGFQITAKFGPVTEHYSGDVCSKKVFHLPAFLGSITWNGLSCPVAKGLVRVGVDVKLSAIIPAKLAKGDILIKAGDANSNGNLICLDIKTSGVETVVV